MMISQRYSKILSLTGFMGCGKSTIGHLIADKMGLEFIDLDSVIEENTQSSIPEIFERIGEYGFRAIERMTLETILNEFVEKTDDSKKSGKKFPAVLALGGGTLTTPECAQLVKRYTKCIYLKASTETLVQNLRNGSDSRPMLKGCTEDESLAKRIEELTSIRSDIYEASAKIVIEIDGKTTEDIVTEILAMLCESDYSTI